MNQNLQQEILPTQFLQIEDRSQSLSQLELQVLEEYQIPE